jgi:hypothetical protein
MPRAFHFWLAVSLLVTLWLCGRLWATRKAIARNVIDTPADGTAN